MNCQKSSNIKREFGFISNKVFCNVSKKNHLFWSGAAELVFSTPRSIKVSHYRGCLCLGEFGKSSCMGVFKFLSEEIRGGDTNQER